MLKTKRAYLKILLVTLLFLLAISTYSFAANVSRVTGLTVNLQSNKNAYLKWDSVSGASGYEIYVDLPSRGYTYIGSVKTNYVTLTGFAQGKTYYAKVRAYNDNNNSTYLDINSSSTNKTYGDYSNEVNIYFSNNSTTTSVQKVTGLNYFTYEKGVSLKWDYISNVSGYEIYVNVPQRGYFYIDSVTSNYVRLTGFPENYTYSAKIRAYKTVNGEKVLGEFSNEVTFTINSYNSIPSQVSKISYNLYNSDLTLSWSSATNASSYEILLYHPNGSYSTYTTTSTSKTIYGLSYGYGYNAKVRAYNSYGYGSYSSTIYFNIVNSNNNYNTPSQVTNLTSRVNGSNVTLSWNSVSYATSYEIILYYPNGNYLTYTSTSNSKTISNLSYGYSYSAKVRAYNSYGYGSYSSKTYFNIVNSNNSYNTPSQVTGLSYRVNNLGLYLSWNSVSNASGYEIILYCPTRGTSTYTRTSNYLDIAALPTGYNYTAKVRAYNSNGYGSYSNTVTFDIVNNYSYNNNNNNNNSTYLPLQVTGLTYSVNGSNVNLRWNYTGYASGYEVTLYYPNGNYSTYTTTDVTKTIYGLSYGYGYSVKVRAYNSKGYGGYSSSVSFNIKNNNNNQYSNVQVSGLTYNVSNRAINLSWNKVADAQGYEVELYFPGVGTLKYTTSDTNRTISGLNVQNGYTVRVRPYFAGSKYGDYSNTIKFNVN